MSVVCRYVCTERLLPADYWYRLNLNMNFFSKCISFQVEHYSSTLMQYYYCPYEDVNFTVQEKLRRLSK